MATQRQDFSIHKSGYSSTRALVKVQFLGCKEDWNVSQQTPKGLCILTSSPLPINPHPQTNPNPWKSALLRVVASIGGKTLSKEAGAGNHAARRIGGQVTFKVLQA